MSAPVCSHTKEESDALFASVTALLDAQKKKALGPEGKKSPEWISFIADLDAEDKKAREAGDQAKIQALVYIRERAEHHQYHDFGGADSDSDDEFGCPKTTLAEDLHRAGFVEMRNNTVRGKYDF